MVYRANERLRFTVPCILYLLVVGDSGSGKSKARTIVYKALTLMLKQLEGRHDRYLSALQARIKGLLKLITGEATSTGMLEMFDKCAISPMAGDRMLALNSVVATGEANRLSMVVANRLHPKRVGLKRRWVRRWEVSVGRTCAVP